jgi:uncharacterized protein (TIGR00251 family)
MKLLLADDDPDQLELRSLALAKAGYETYLAIDVKTALQLAEKHRPDLAVVDLRIPKEEAGLRLIRELKQLDIRMRVIVLSGSDAKRLETLPERALVEAVITKGSASRKLVEYLRDCARADLRSKLAVEGQLILDVKVTPRSAKSEIVEFLGDGSLRIKVAAVPEKGKANEELAALLAELFEVPKHSVELLSGDTSQRKRLRIHGAKAT